MKGGNGGTHSERERERGRREWGGDSERERERWKRLGRIVKRKRRVRDKIGKGE